MEDPGFYCDEKRHLVCVPYSIKNLHEMAKKLNIHKCWFHKDHYDIPLMRMVSIMGQCKVTTTREILKIIGR